jgi:hypothetical protein
MAGGALRHILPAAHPKPGQLLPMEFSDYTAIFGPPAIAKNFLIEGSAPGGQLR